MNTRVNKHALSSKIAISYLSTSIDPTNAHRTVFSDRIASTVVLRTSATMLWMGSCQSTLPSYRVLPLITLKYKDI